MRDIRKIWSIRLAAGALLGAILTTLLAWLLLSFGVSNGQSIPVSPAAVQFYGSAALALVVQLLLGGLFGAVVSLATLPFANEGKKLILLSLVHWGATVLCFSLLLTGCRWLDFGWDLLPWVALLTLLYFLIWLGRWIGWYMEVIQLRELLGLAAGPSPLKWRETLPYLPFLLLVCNRLPAALRWVDRTFVVDVPVLSGLLLPYLILPVVGYLSGLSLGKRQGVCPLYPLACFLFYLPMVYLIYNSSALFHCFMIALPALAGNVMGWLYRRAFPRKNRTPSEGADHGD